MERLTHWNCRLKRYTYRETSEGHAWRRTMQALAAYENTGLTPERIREMDQLYSEMCKEIGEYQKAEEQGLLLRLPCKVGDTVYDLVFCDDNRYRIFEMKVCSISKFGSIHNGRVWNLYLEDKYSKAYRKFDDFGKTVFLTREEAEAALAEMEGRSEREEKLQRDQE